MNRAVAADEQQILRGLCPLVMTKSESVRREISSVFDSLGSRERLANDSTSIPRSPDPKSGIGKIGSAPRRVAQGGGSWFQPLPKEAKGEGGNIYSVYWLVYAKCCQPAAGRGWSLASEDCSWICLPSVIAPMRLMGIPAILVGTFLFGVAVNSSS